MSFTYAGPSVAATFVTGVFNDAADRAAAKAAESAAEFAAARGQLAVIPAALAGTPSPEPVITPPVFDLSALLSRQDEIDAIADTRSNLLTGLVEDLDDFMAQYFPGVDAAVAAARQALTSLLAGSNFADGREVAGQRIDQVRIKVLRDVQEREDALIASYAARGFPLPPGGLMNDLTQLRKGDLYAVADEGWGIEQAEAGREKEALERTMRLLTSARADAIKAFAGYLAAACLGNYDSAMKETEASLRSNQLLSDAMYQQLVATNRAGALQLKAMESDHGLARQYLGGLDKLAEQRSAAQLQGAAAMAKTLGTQAATAYNAIRASASVRGSEEMNDL